MEATQWAFKAEVKRGVFADFVVQVGANAVANDLLVSDGLLQSHFKFSPEERGLPGETLAQRLAFLRLHEHLLRHDWVTGSDEWSGADSIRMKGPSVNEDLGEPLTSGPDFVIWNVKFSD